MPPEGSILLYGAGREARSTRHFLAETQPGTEIFVTADEGTAEIADATYIPPGEVAGAVAARRFGLIVKSPGVSLYKPVFDLARQSGVPITSNLNLWANRYRAGRTVIAVTGTKGKSTTATLAHLMLRHSGLDAGLAGNVGVAPLDIADRHAIVVFELSSYQTADIGFCPDIAALTNLYPEHIDWHGSLERYYADKLNLLRQPGPLKVALGKQAMESETVRSGLTDEASLLPPLAQAVEDRLLDAARSSRLKGTHNVENARIAARIALAAGATLDGIVTGISAFAPLPHRLEEHVIDGVVFVDDSISTTPEATKAALSAYNGYRIALLAGGHERQQDYNDLAGLLAGHGVKTLVCLPATGGRLASAARARAPHIEVIAAPHLRAAMEELARRRAGFDAVILSPGAPSYHQLRDAATVFNNFEERGAAFIAFAHELFERNAGAIRPAADQA